MSDSPSFNKYIPFALIYFFFNGVLFNNQVLLTTLLTPLLFYLCLNEKNFRALVLITFTIFLYAVYHFATGTNKLFFLKSATGLISVAVFSISAHYFIVKSRSITYVFKVIILVNTFLIPIAILSLFSPTFKSKFWYTNPITTGIESFSRLKMLTYEPSYYALLWVPIAVYFTIKFFISPSKNIILPLILIALPLALSLSFGVLSCLFISVALTVFVYRRKIFKSFHARELLYICTSIFLLSMIFLTLLYPNNILFLRISNVLAGKDISFSGRTTDSFDLAWKILSEKSEWFGAGLGQTKLYGLRHFKEFYNDNSFTIDQIGIPNAVGDTLATFGISGIIIRFAIQIYFFITTSPYKNAFRLCMFTFIFIYQFTGSFIMNIAEYVIWIFAFTPGPFKEFDLQLPNLNKNENTLHSTSNILR